MNIDHIFKLANQFYSFAKADYLWHGSRDKIEVLTPRQAVDVGGNPDNNREAIYATDLKDFAIMMGLTTKESDTGLFWGVEPFQMVLYSGKIRKGDKLYLHKLPRKDKSGKEMFVPSTTQHEYYSKSGVSKIEPIEIIELEVDDYLDLIRKATKEDLNRRKKFSKDKK